MSTLSDALSAFSYSPDQATADDVPDITPDATAALKGLYQDAKQDAELPVDVFAKSVLLKLDTGMLGTSKKLGSSQIEVDADKNRIKAAKSILDSPQLDAIRTEISQASKRIRNLCLPSPFKRGIYLLPIASIADADQILVESQAAIMAFLVPAFLEVYPALVEADKLALRGDTYNAADYPPADIVRDQFTFDWSYIAFGVPPALKGIDSELFIREQKKAAAKLTQAVDDIQNLLRAQMLELVTHLADQMTGVSSDGKAKAIKTASVVNINKFLDAFSAKNITDDKELDALCEQAKDLLNGVDPQALRDSITTKDKVVAGFQEIKTELDKLMVNKPSRMIKFAEPGEEN